MNRLDKAARWVAALLVGVLAIGMQSGAVSAHAVPERAFPEMNTAVPVMPAIIEIWFSEEVKTEGTKLEVLKLDGTQVDLGNTTLDLEDPSRSLVTIGVHAGLDNGVYVVQWTSVSAIDGDTVSGSYQFTVDPSASPQALPQVATQQAPVQLPAVDDEESNDRNRNPLLYGMVAVVTGLALLGLIVFWFFRRPSRGRRWSDRPVDRL